MLSKRFPFGIYYEVENDAVYVYAIWICGAIFFGFGSVCAREDRAAFVIQRVDARQWMRVKLRSADR